MPSARVVQSVEPRYNEGPRDWQNLFAITRFRYIEVLFHRFSYYWGTEYRSLYRGLRYIEVRYISRFHCTHKYAPLVLVAIRRVSISTNGAIGANGKAPYSDGSIGEYASH